MGKYLGKLAADAFGAVVNEMKIGHYHIPAAKVVAPDSDGILDGEAFGPAGKVVTTFLAQPPTAMTLTAAASGTQTGKIQINGYDLGGQSISEELTLTSSTPVTTSKAFAEVTSVVMPAKVASETLDLGWGGSFGLPYALAADELVIVKLFNNAADAGTVTVDVTDVAKNVFDPSGTPDGEKALDFYILV